MHRSSTLSCLTSSCWSKQSVRLHTPSSLLDILAAQINVQPKFTPFLFLWTHKTLTGISTSIYRPYFNYRPFFERWRKQKQKSTWCWRYYPGSFKSTSVPFQIHSPVMYLGNYKGLWGKVELLVNYLVWNARCSG